MRPALPLRSLPPVAATLGVNAVPVLGWLRETWSAETVMILYYLETVSVALLVGLMIRFVVPATDEKGLPIDRKRNTLVRDYGMVMGGFALVIGVFIATILLLFRGVVVPWAAVGAAMAVIVALQILSYSWQAYQLRPLDIADAHTLIDRDIGRIAVLHLGVLAGSFLMAFRAEWFVWPFIALKTLVDVGMVVEPLAAWWRGRGDSKQ